VIPELVADAAQKEEGPSDASRVVVSPTRIELTFEEHNRRVVVS
jgi:hypothetical protein